MLPSHNFILQKTKKTCACLSFFFAKAKNLTCAGAARDAGEAVHCRDMTDALFLFFASLPSRAHAHTHAHPHTLPLSFTLSLTHTTHTHTHTHRSWRSYVCQGSWRCRTSTCSSVLNFFTCFTSTKVQILTQKVV
jgi:hypothetical protein